MDYFKINKYSAVNDNILYISKNIIEILSNGSKSFGKIVDEYEKLYMPDMSLNIEANIYLAMLFLYQIDRIKIQGKKIKLEVKKLDLQ